MRDYFTRQVLFSRDSIETTSLILQALDGFCFILDDRYRILYITESVSTHLGFSQEPAKPTLYPANMNPQLRFGSFDVIRNVNCVLDSNL
ncbi:hypothetical protein NECAME_17568 [Necator americanus]|uniref:PAS domain-containing protein n=1 Tax=Necator americanus TaxID=51031 RepID=W2TPR2_NECAM|nr:hypothetical protein NECAME_17568 [Necator americanus]ETN83126.1 hypothetical protein NECAME_17568 [Necator americanus]